MGHEFEDNEGEVPGSGAGEGATPASTAETTSVSTESGGESAAVSAWNGEMDHLDTWAGWEAHKNDINALKMGLKTGLELKTKNVERGFTAKMESLAAERRSFEAERASLEQLKSLLLDDEPANGGNTAQAPDMEALKATFRSELAKDPDFLKEVIGNDAELNAKLATLDDQTSMFETLKNEAADREIDELLSMLAARAPHILAPNGDDFDVKDQAKLDEFMATVYKDAANAQVPLVSRLAGKRPWDQNTLEGVLKRYEAPVGTPVAPVAAQSNPVKAPVTVPGPSVRAPERTNPGKLVGSVNTGGPSSGKSYMEVMREREREARNSS